MLQTFHIYVLCILGFDMLSGFRAFDSVDMPKIAYTYLYVTNSIFWFKEALG